MLTLPNVCLEVAGVADAKVSSGIYSKEGVKSVLWVKGLDSYGK